MSSENKKTKPNCPLVGQDGKIFNLVGIASRVLKRNGMSSEASEMTEKVFRFRGVAYPAVFVCNDLEYFYTAAHLKQARFSLRKILCFIAQGRNGLFLIWLYNAILRFNVYKSTTPQAVTGY